jgi:radical SAM protein with 4Fe4S-binding SPASM domain
MNTEFPHKILMQWHITDRCNYRCGHCYQEHYNGTEPDWRALEMILFQFRDLLAAVGQRSGRTSARGHITVTGGEPFVREDFPHLLERLSASRAWTSFGILSNGSLIDASTARKLKDLGTSFVQISIEGSPATHDRIRGEGSHDRAVTALKHLARAGVRTLISFTAHRANFREFPEVVRLGRRLKVRRVWSDRLIPQGNGLHPDCGPLDPAETREFMEIMARSRKGSFVDRFRGTEVNMGRALQFLTGGGKPYSCEAGRGLITIMPDGTLYPCRRMTVASGNVLDTPLRELYFENRFFQSLRDRTVRARGCEDCFYEKLCRGGLRCLSYAVTGDPFNADPGCWRARQTAPTVSREVRA